MSGPIVLALRILLTISLYGFLIWAFLSMGREIHRQSMLVTNRRIPPLVLSISHGTTPPQTRFFNQAEIFIGREASCECPLEDETISARHALLSFHHSQWWLEDLGSKNGTLLNGERLTIPTVVMNEDRIHCGETELQIALSDEKAVKEGREPPERLRL
jgi:pSer/pThr/pTyr-binding forkhead associated (FHA) protein